MQLRNFLQRDERLREIEQGNAIFYEQLTRHVFYHRSTLAERRQMIEQHFSFCRNRFYFPGLQQVYYDQRLRLWEGVFSGSCLSFGLDFFYADRKEGLMSLDLMLGERRIYHITFAVIADDAGEDCIRIGALQGSLGGQTAIHRLTKEFFGYRPKNLMLYGLRILAAGLGIRKIEAVSNQGFFTNTHVRLDRKLKTSLDEFWLEAGGRALPDPRFFALPAEEPRKSIEEVKSQKRNLYRKRYGLLDTVAAGFMQKLQQYVKPVAG